MATLNGLIITEDFTDENKLLFPVTPWQIILDSGIKKLVSNTIGNNTSTNISFNINCSHLEIDYKVSSEGNYDWLYIYVDGAQKVKVSGTSATTYSTYTTDLTYGNHTIKFQYSKDSSSSSGKDRGEIWAIRYTTQKGINQYLIADGTDVKTIPIGTTDLSTLTTLTTLGAYPMNDISYFTNNGMIMEDINYIINNKRDLLTSLNPKILVYSNWLPKCIVPDVKIKERQNPYGQLVEMKNDIIFNSVNISHINKCNIVATVSTNAILKFIFSKDGGTTWIAWNGSTWTTVIKTVDDIIANGMTLDVCNGLTEEQLISISDTKQIKVAWVMKRVENDNATVKQIKFEYASV